jgi:hypothetical protein
VGPCFRLSWQSRRLWQSLSPVFLALAAHCLTERVFRFQPRLARPAPIGRINPLRHDALQPQAAGMVKHRAPSCARCSLSRMAYFALPNSFASRRLRSISGTSRKSSPSCSIRSNASASPPGAVVASCQSDRPCNAAHSGQTPSAASSSWRLISSCRTSCPHVVPSLLTTLLART